jgi:hypothetical protein
MGIKVRDAGNVLRTITQIRVRDAGNVLRTIQRVRIRDAGNVLRTVWEAVTFLITGGTYTHATGGVATATVAYQLNSSGKEQYRLGTSGGFTDIGNWVVPNGAASQYEVRATLTSGTFTSGTAGSWLALTSTRTWTTQQVSLGSKTTSATIEIRNATTLAIVATGSITLLADNT